MIRFNYRPDGYRIAKEAGQPFNPAVDVVISRVEDGKLLGGVIFNGFTGASIAIHMAGFDPHWVNRDMLWVAFDYPFRQLDCKKLFGLLPSSNQKALEIDLKLGFKKVAVIPEVYPDADMVVLEMRREDCRWLNLTPRELRRGSNGGQEQGTGAA